MILTIIFYVVGFLFGILTDLLSYIPWPQLPENFTNGITYFSQNVMKLDFILPMVELMQLFVYVTSFLIAYLVASITIKFFNWLRGAGSM